MAYRGSTILLGAIAAISGLGVLIASGNLVTLPMVAAQLTEAVPNAAEAVEKAVSISRRKSYIGLMMCLPVFLLCVVSLVGKARRPTPSS